MKKILTTILAAVMLVSNTGRQAGQQSEQPAPQAIVIDVAPTNDRSDEPIDTSAVLEQITAGIKIKPDTAEKKKNETRAPKQESAGDQNANRTAAPTAVAATPAPKEPDTGYLIVKVKAIPTPPTTTPTPSAATPAPASTPAPTPEPPAPTPEPPIPTPEPAQPTPEPIIEEPSFDISYWIGYAQSYAQGLGLRWRAARWTAGTIPSGPDPTAPAWSGTSQAD